METNGTWIDEETWICGEHMPPVRLPSAASRCYYANCNTCRPEEEDGDEPTSVYAQRFKAHQDREDQRIKNFIAPRPTWTGDVKPAASSEEVVGVSVQMDRGDAQVLPLILAETGVQQCEWHSCDKPARPGSKYCGRACSNRNARARHRARKKSAA